MANSVEVTVRSPTASTTDLRMKIGLNDTVGEIKQRLFREHPDQPRPDEQRLIFAGRVLADDARTADVLLQYDVSRPQTFHLMTSPSTACRSTQSAPAGRAEPAAGARRPPAPRRRAPPPPPPPRPPPPPPRLPSPPRRPPALRRRRGTPPPPPFPDTP